MPRAAERRSRRARGLCVECPVRARTARCRACRRRERERERGSSRR